MLSDRGYEELTYQIDQIDSQVFNVSNTIIDLNLDDESKAKLNKQVDNIVLNLNKLKQELLHY